MPRKSSIASVRRGDVFLKVAPPLEWVPSPIIMSLRTAGVPVKEEPKRE